jgi:hypothetical protein
MNRVSQTPTPLIGTAKFHHATTVQRSSTACNSKVFIVFLQGCNLKGVYAHQHSKAVHLQFPPLTIGRKEKSIFQGPKSSWMETPAFVFISAPLRPSKVHKLSWIHVNGVPHWLTWALSRNMTSYSLNIGYVNLE